MYNYTFLCIKNLRNYFVYICKCIILDSKRKEIMTKKHFERIARILGQHKREQEFHKLVNMLMNFFDEENSSFDRARFLDEIKKASYSKEIPKDMQRKLTIPNE